MPVAQRRMRIRRKHHAVHAELRQPRRITDAPLFIAHGHRAMRLGVDQTVTQCRRIDVNFWHVSSVPLVVRPDQAGITRSSAA